MTRAPTTVPVSVTGRATGRPRSALRVGLLTQWYDPEPGPAALPGVLARGLRDRGHDVQVVTGFPNYPTGTLAPGYTMSRRIDEDLEGIAVRRVALYTSHDASGIRRIANYASFGASAVVSGTSALAGLDALWVNYSPITIAWAQWAARYALGVPTVAHVLDLWPDTLQASGFAATGRAGAVAERVLHAWTNGMYQAADSVAYISPGVGDVLARRGVPRRKLAYVPMWADEAVFRPSEEDLRVELGIAEDTVVLLYAGALGRAQGIEALIEACARVDDPNFVALVAGSGVCESELRARANELGVDNVRFLGRLPQARMTALMATGDVSYVALQPHLLSPITMPSKTQAALASGTALLVAAQGDVAQVVTESGTGISTVPGDPDRIADAINRLCRLGRPHLHEMGRTARHFYEQTFSAARGVERVENLLAHAAATKGRT